ncbi:MAG: nucleoside transporter [Phycisphaerae bacterium]|nr:nucleoside transporter [Phycisphaerae bacterium]
MDIYNVVSFAGLFVLMFVAWAFSVNRRVVNVRCIAAGVGLQLVLAAVVFWAPGSTRFFLWLNDVVVAFLHAAMEGQRFLFGPLAVGPGQTDANGSASIGFILATQALAVIIFFAALMGVLYYFGIMQRIIQAFAWVFVRLMRISGAESLCAASNIFVGIESTTAVRPYLAKMTRSEFCTILTAGMATVASSTMGVYVLFLKDVFGTIAGHLISASVLSAPAAIVVSKILVPETDQPITLGVATRFHYERESGPIEAIINGAMAGVKLVVGVCALLIALLGMLAVLDLFLGWAGVSLHWIDADSVRSPLSALMGCAMWPFAVIIGVPPTDALLAGQMLGQRLIATEIPAYLHLAEVMGTGGFVHPRSAVIVAYALCGFAHVASLAIFIGGVSAIVPGRRADLAKVAPRALLAATLACLMTGAVAGTFYHETTRALQAVVAR